MRPVGHRLALSAHVPTSLREIVAQRCLRYGGRGSKLHDGEGVHFDAEPRARYVTTRSRLQLGMQLDALASIPAASAFTWSHATRAKCMAASVVESN